MNVKKRNRFFAMKRATEEIQRIIVERMREKPQDEDETEVLIELVSIYGKFRNDLFESLGEAYREYCEELEQPEKGRE